MTSQQPQKRPTKGKPSKQMQRVYLRRRIVVGVAALVILALVGFGVYALVTKVIVPQAGHIASSSSIAKSHKKSPKPKKSNGSGDAKSEKSDKNNQNGNADQSSVKKCGAKDVKLELSPVSQSVEVGGSLDFKATIRYEGSGSCLVDASNASRILTISSIADSDSGNGSGADSKQGSDSKSNSNSDANTASSGETIWSSAACPADSRKLLMAKGDKDEQKITWPADKTGSTCVPDDQLPRVKRGTYMAQLSLKDQPSVKSEKVPVVVK
ncbi:hypothetical protein OZX73_07420 [Bifidobacterium sp. ESL0775]|uniref:hypothetical protein n=1 Tax=Bifidobacterium sp. ESL0775 TaxID=2983230 RepID=UPI0023F9E72C|nr:hypothetical protein [Bifidobacterium sp. ESL0775]WEV69079.1 hypothetical protein OZX73_07420 [Bifidobacterium sp. ESL0775]